MSKRYFFCTVVLVIAALFTSCENFLRAKDVKDEVEDIIAYNNAKIVPVSLSCEKEMGSIYPQNSYNARLGFAFELQYVPNTENYIIDGESSIFEAVSRFSGESRADCVEIIPVEQSIEDKRVGLFRAKVKVIKSADDILLRPCPIQVPKVIDISPANSVTGYPQDSTIRITFNKPVAPDSFGFFSCIKILNGSNKDMTSYYGTPYFSNDNTILNISAVAGKPIIQDDAGSDYEDITISINFTNITDAEGIQITQNKAYTFRLNKTKDTEDPKVNSIVLKTTSDTSQYYYHELTEKVFEEWTDTATAENPYGDFSQNHVGGTFYIETSGYDKDSGVNGIQVIETFYKTVTDEDTSLSTTTGICGINKQVFLQTDNDNNNIYSINDTYTFVSKNDGVFKLEISLLDNAGRSSESKTFYVIKDSTIGPDIISFKETKDPYNIYLPDDPTTAYDSYTDIFNVARSSQNGTDTVVLTLLESSGEAFYETSGKTYLSKCDAEIYYGSSVNAINKKARAVNKTFSFTANPDEITYVKVLALDDVGNKIAFIRAIPPKPKLSNYKTKISGNNKDLRINVFSDLEEGLGADSNGFFYVVRNNSIANTNFGAAPRESDGFLEIIDYYGYEGINESYKNLDIFVVAYLKYGNNYWYSVLSDDYVNMNATINASGYRMIYGNPTSSLSSSEKTLNNSFGSYVHDNIQITTKPYEKNSGYSEFTIFDYKTELGEAATDVVYTYVCIDYDNQNLEYHFTEPTFILPSMRRYNLYIYVEEINGSMYFKSPYFWVYANGATNYISNHSFDLTDDSFAPSFPDVTHNVDNDDQLYWIETSANYPTDGPESTIVGSDVAVGMAETYETSGVGVMDYYFIPDSNVHRNDYTVYTMQDLAAYENEKRTIEYSFSGTGFKIPYNYLDDGLYTLCLVAKDKNGNYAIKCAPAFNKVLDIKVPLKLGKSSDTLIITSGENFSFERYNFDEKNWKPITVKKLTSGTWRGTISLTSDLSTTWAKVSGRKIGKDTFDSGYYLVDYFYIPHKRYELYPNIYSPLEFTSKEVIECLTGYHVYCNYPVLIHTMYCEKKLTETNTKQDIAIWETKGFETGFMIQSGDYSYTKENYREIPTGYYYTTIFHLPDGETIMTPIKQK